MASDTVSSLYEITFESAEGEGMLMPIVRMRDLPLPGDRVAINNAEYEVVRRVWIIADRTGR